MEEQYQLTLSDYLEIARRRWLHFLVPFVLVFAASVAVALYLPPVFKSSGTILIESQQIPDELIRSTVTSYADERIQVIQQLVMTRDNLLRISEKFNLFKGEQASLTVTQKVDELRSRIDVSRIVGELAASRRSTTTIAFTVGFEDRSPDTAYNVANELITLFLEENVKTRTARASETTEFLRDQSDKLKVELESIEAQIAAYKQQNSQALPEHLDLHMSMLERTEVSLKDIEREIKTARDDLRFLEVERGAVDQGLTGTGSPAAPSSPAQSLAMAQSELARLEGIYAPKHPAVRRQRQLVENLRAEVETATQGDETAVETMVAAANLDLARINARISSVDNRLTSLEAQRDQLRERRTELEEIIIQTPQVERALASLSRDYDNTLAKYNEIQSKEMEAQVAESLEEGKKAERFSLIEPPVRPDTPIKPDRLKLLAMGFAAAGALAFGLVVLLELSDQRIRTVESLTRLMGDRPMIAIPYIVIDEEVARRRRLMRLALAAAAGAVVVLLVLMHFLYMPLDMLAIKIMTRLS